MATRFLKINRYGELYQKAEATTPGAVKITTNDGKEYYHIVVKNTIKGKPSIYRSEFEVNGGKVYSFNIALEASNGDKDVISIPFYTSKGGLNPYIQSVVLALYEADNSLEYSVSPSKKVNDRGYLIRNIFFNDNEGGYLKNTKELYESIPFGEKKESMGKTVWDFTERDNKVYEMFEDIVKRQREEYAKQNPQQANETKEETSKTTEAVSKSTEPAPQTLEEEDDGLPF